MNIYQNKNLLLILFLLVFINVLCGEMYIIGIYTNTLMNLVYQISTVSLVCFLLVLILKSKTPNSDDTLKKEIFKITNGLLNKGLSTMKNRLGDDTIRQKKVKSSIKIIEDAVSKLTDLYEQK
tara:strand:- start:245 stop:613 length:369 start_codon:yes stop_codon:yes gene_type:complete